MPLIEGLGDEVTLVLAGFFICIILTLAWFSTHTADIPLLREVGVIVVELSQRRSRTRTGVDGERSGESTEQTSTEESSLGQQESSSGHQESSEITQDLPTTEGSNLLSGGSGTQARLASGSVVNDVTAQAESISNVSGPSTANQTTETSVTDGKCTAASQGLLSEAVGDVRPEVSHEISSLGMAAGTDTGDPHGAETGDPHRAETGDPHRAETGDPHSQDIEYSESSVPRASVTVEDNRGDSHSVGDRLPTGEEIRRRRVKYFQSPGAPVLSDSIAGEENTSVIGNVSNVSDISNQANHIKPRSDSTQTPGEVDNSRQSLQVNSAAVTDSGDSTTTQEFEEHQQESMNADSEQGMQDDMSPRIRVKLKYMNETQRLVYASPNDTIGDFRRTHFQSELEDNKWVRFIYNGQDLRDDARTLQACNIGDNCTMHCLITAPARPSSAGDALHEDEEESMMGALMYPLFTVVLLIVWYFRFTYRQYFSAMSTVCLMGISFLLALSFISSLRTQEPRPARGQPAGSGSGAAQPTPEHQHTN